MSWASEFLVAEEWWACYIGVSAWAILTSLALLFPSSASSISWTPRAWSGAADLAADMSAPSVAWLACVGVFVVGSLTLARMATATLASDARCRPLASYAWGVCVVFVLSALSSFLGSCTWLSRFGLDSTVWALAFGIVLSNTMGVNLPEFLQLVSTKADFFIKCGLVLMAVAFQSLIKLGLPGIVVSWPVTIAVIVFTWFISRIPIFRSVTPQLGMCMSCGVAVCGNSAVVAVAPVVKASKSDMTLVVSVLTIGNIPLMLFLPYFCKWVKMSEPVAGSWLGGTLDATWAVVAAAKGVGPTSLEIGSLVKMIQNSIIGCVTVGVFVFWIWSGRDNEDSSKSEGKQKVTLFQLLKRLWTGFPKFIFGFLFVSVLISYAEAPILMYNNTLVAWTVSSLKVLSGWFFLCSFVAIGISCDIKKIFGQLKSGGLIMIYLLGSLFDFLLTFAVAYLMFSGLLLPIPVVV